MRRLNLQGMQCGYDEKTLELADFLTIEQFYLAPHIGLKPVKKSM